MHPKLLAFVALTFAVNSSFGAPGSEPTPSLLGAEAALRAAATVAPAPGPGGQAENAVQALLNSARKLRQEQASLSPAEAATRWQALWFQMIRIKPDYASGITPEDLLSVLLSALPRPEAWPLIKPQPKPTVQEPKKDQSLLEAVGQANGNRSASLPEVRQLLSLVLTQNFNEAETLCKNNTPLLQTIRSLRLKMEARSFEAMIEAKAKATDNFGASVEIPDVLPGLGAEKTKEIALKLLKQGAQISRISGRETAALFRETALASATELANPPWELCYSPDGATLYDALEQRVGHPFKPGTENPQDYRIQMNNRRAAIAMIWRAFSWAKSGNAEKAVQLLTQVSNVLPEETSFGIEPSDIAERFGLAPETMYEILAKVGLTTRSSWAAKTMIALAPAAHKVDETLALLTPSAETSPIDQLRFAELELTLRLAQGDREKAFAILQEAVSANTAPQSGPDAASPAPNIMPTRGDSISAIKFRLAAKACEIGLLTDQKNLVTSSVKSLNRLAVEFPPANGYDPLKSTLLQAATALMEHQLLSEAESLLITALTRCSPDKNDWEPNQVLARLVQLYDKAKRPGDVIKLLSDAPQWSASDAGLLPPTENFWFCLAKALATNPQTRQQALEITLAGLKKNPAEDDGFELLLELQGSQALPLLDQMMKTDRWEERPLIWKAEMLRRLGRLAEAEVAARAALAIDPTDGEQPSGKRVRGYAVLAAILDAQGRQADAKIYHQVVASVHMAEQGDALRNAGLLTEALAKYEEAAVYFADAYCVQWRLGERLMQAGRIAEAEKHYEAAFSRMPEQFGRMASLCFGCENIFGNTSSRSAADRVLSKLAEKPNALPQALFILARLRVAQDRNAEAYALLQRAVKQDAEYMDAWKAMLSLCTTTNAPADERKMIIQQLLTLDPSTKHTELKSDDLLILGPIVLWQRLQTTLDQSTTGKLSYPLPAAARRLEASKGSITNWLEQENRRKKLFGEFARENTWDARGRDFIQAFESLLSPYVRNGFY